MLYAVAIAVFALFAACERPEPKPEPPTTIVEGLASTLLDTIALNLIM